MKKILISLMCILLLPLSVNAVASSESFNVGDRVAVNIKGPSDRTQFYVIKDSKPGDNYVWMIYYAVIEGSSTIYDGDIPDEHEATGVLENAVINTALLEGTASWINAEEIRLLMEADLAPMGITKGASGKYEIKANRFFMAPILIPEVQAAMWERGYDYWTQIYETKENGDVEVYAVTYNNDYNGDTLTPMAYLTPQNISTITGPKYVIRPVVKVDKQYIDCVVGATTKPKNPETSEVAFPLELLGVIAIAGIVYVVARKKGYFTNI